MNLQPVVIVEDQPADLELALAAFERAGLRNPLIVLRDGGEALAYLRDCLKGHPDEEPALVLLDIGLPKVDGYELLAIANDDTRLRGLPIVMVTGSGKEEELLRYYGMDARGFVAKPLTVEKLASAASAAGAYCQLTGNGTPTLSIVRTMAYAPA